MKDHILAKWRPYLAMASVILGTIAASGLIDPLSTSGVILGTVTGILASLGFGAAKQRIEDARNPFGRKIIDNSKSK